MIWNLLKTVSGAKAVNTVVEVTIEDAPQPEVGGGVIAVITGRPLWFSVVALVLTGAFFFAESTAVAVILAVAVLVVGEVAYVLNKRARAKGGASWFGLIESRPLAFTVLTLIAVLIGGVAEILPMVLVKQAVPVTGASRSRTPRWSNRAAISTRARAATCATRR